MFDEEWIFKLDVFSEGEARKTIPLDWFTWITNTNKSWRNELFYIHFFHDRLSGWKFIQIDIRDTDS